VEVVGRTNYDQKDTITNQVVVIQGALKDGVDKN